jgi:hypothetical protein
MNNLNKQSDWPHSKAAPLRWVRAVVAAFDEQLAALCAAQWQRPQAIRVLARRELRSPRRFR